MTARKGMPALEHLKRCQSFLVSLLPERWSEAYNPHDPTDAHEKVLRPLLRNAHECWAYEIMPNSDVEASAGNILERIDGKCKVRLDGEPIIGHEFFWNAHGGARGTILVTVPMTAFDAEKIFPHCEEPRVLANFSASNTPSAVRFARSQTASGELIAFLFSRNNGFEWMHVLAAGALIERLFQRATALCKR